MLRGSQANICIYIYTDAIVKRLLRSTWMQPPSPFLPDCVCASLRQASRAITQIYDEALQPSGLRAMQFQILSTLEVLKEAALKDLAQILTLDQTTLTRSLKLLEEQGWIAQKPSSDRRLRVFALSRSGKAVLLRAKPLWERVQAETLTILDQEAWQSTRGQLKALIAHAVQKGQEK